MATAILRKTIWPTAIEAEQHGERGGFRAEGRLGLRSSAKFTIAAFSNALVVRRRLPGAIGLSGRCRTVSSSRPASSSASATKLGGLQDAGPLLQEGRRRPRGLARQVRSHKGGDGSLGAAQVAHARGTGGSAEIASLVEAVHRCTNGQVVDHVPPASFFESRMAIDVTTSNGASGNP